MCRLNACVFIYESSHFQKPIRAGHYPQGKSEASNHSPAAEADAEGRRPGELARLDWPALQLAATRTGEGRLTNVSRVKIRRQGIVFGDAPEWDRVKNVSTRIGRYAVENFAQLDGFDGWESMRKFFTREHGLPFIGILIEAEDI
jgi:hypothetical protein